MSTKPSVLPDADITQNNTSSPHILYKFHNILLQIALSGGKHRPPWIPYGIQPPETLL